jgi:hypothetical protein
MKSNPKGALQQVVEAALVSPPAECPEQRASDTHSDPVARFYDILDSTEELVSADLEPDWESLEEAIAQAFLEVLPSVPISEVASEFAFELIARVQSEWLKSATGCLKKQNNSLSANLSRLKALEPYEAAKRLVTQRVLELRVVNEAAGVFMTRIETIRDHLDEVRRVAEQIPPAGRWLNKPPQDEDAWVRMFDEMVRDSKCWPERPGRPRKAGFTP